MDFESTEALACQMNSDSGAAAAADIAGFATGGATMVHFDVHTVPL